jgi:hypothetical protein
MISERQSTSTAANSETPELSINLLLLLEVKYYGVKFEIGSAGRRFQFKTPLYKDLFKN